MKTKRYLFAEKLRLLLTMSVLLVCSPGRLQAQTDPCAATPLALANDDFLVEQNCRGTIPTPVTANFYEEYHTSTTLSLRTFVPGIFFGGYTGSVLVAPTGQTGALARSTNWEKIYGTSLDVLPSYVPAAAPINQFHGAVLPLGSTLDTSKGFTVLVKFYNSTSSSVPADTIQVFGSLLQRTNANHELLTFAKRGGTLLLGRAMPDSWNAGGLSKTAVSHGSVGYFEQPWEPRDTVPGGLEYIYYTFTPDGKLRIDRFREMTGGVEWEAGIADGGLIFESSTTQAFPDAGIVSANSSNYQPGDFIVGPKMSTSIYPGSQYKQSAPDGMIGVSIFAKPLALSQIIAWQNSQFGPYTNLAQGFSPCNTGYFLGLGRGAAPQSPIETPCGPITLNSSSLPLVGSRMPPGGDPPTLNGTVSDTPTKVAQNSPGPGRSLLNTDGPPPSNLLSLSPLHTSGASIVDANNKVVPLRGVNLGGWLETESWMDGEKTPDPANPANFINDNYALVRLESRFGTSAGDSLMTNWQNNFITDADFAQIQSAGFNMVRVPLSWRNLMDETGKLIVNSNGAVDFSRLDAVVDEAYRHQLYVLFDLHIWPGRQQCYQDVVTLATSTTCSAAQNPHPSPFTPLQQLQMVQQIWAAMAQHYLGNGTIAGFDLLNEVPPASAQMWQSLYSAVQDVDPNRILFVERGKYDWMDQGYSNLVYSAHLYNFDSTDPTNVQQAYNSNPGSNNIPINGSGQWPVYIGEFKLEPNTAPWLLSQMNHSGWSWSPWTWKGINVGGWAMVDYGLTPSSATVTGYSPQVNLASDSAATIQSSWTTGLSPSKTITNSQLLAAFTSGATQPVFTSVNSAPAGYTRCASEGQTCSFSGNASVAFGANGSYYFLNAANSVVCSVATFGDPNQGASKACYERTLTSAGPSGFSFCASENEFCSFSGAEVIAYGAGSNFTFKMLSDGVSCSNNVFSDPDHLVTKACYVLKASALVGPSNSTFCAPQEQQCSFTGTQVIAYGNSPFFSYVTATGSVTCSATTFANFGTTAGNACYVVTNLPAVPSGYTYCGTADSGCQFHGVADVIYQKANGTQYSGVQQNGFACNLLALGIQDYGGQGDFCSYKLNASDLSKIPTIDGMIGLTGPVLAIDLLTNSVMIDSSGTAATSPNMVKLGSQQTYPVWLINWLGDNHFTIASGPNNAMVLTAQAGSQGCGASSICAGTISDQPYVPGQLNQIWQIVFDPSETVFRILNQATGLALDSSQDNNGDAGANTFVHTWNGFPWAHNQQWQFLSAVNDVNGSCTNKATVSLSGAQTYRFMFVNTTNQALATFHFDPSTSGSITVGAEVSDTCTQGTIFPGQSCYFTVPVTSTGAGSGQVTWTINSTWYDSSFFGQLFGNSASVTTAKVCQNFNTN